MDYTSFEFAGADHLGNWNWDVNIRNLDASDLCDGMYVQSFGNLDCIYKIRNCNGVLSYGPTHRIVSRALHKKDSKIVKIDPKSCWTRSVPSQWDMKWSETIYSRMADPQYTRMEKLESLGI